MRQELKALHLAVDKEEARPLKVPKARRGARAGTGEGAQRGRRGTEDGFLCVCSQLEQGWEESREEEEGQGPDLRQVADPPPLAVGGGVGLAQDGADCAPGSVAV